MVKCLVCKRELKDRASVERGIGPICLSKLKKAEATKEQKPLEAFEAGESRSTWDRFKKEPAGEYPEGLHNVTLRAPARLEHPPITPSKESEAPSKCQKCGASYMYLGEDNGLCATCHYEAIATSDRVSGEAVLQGRD